MKSPSQRLNNIIGQIEGIKSMMAEKKDCVQVLTQLKAVRSAVNGVIDAIVEDQLDNCMKTLNKKDKELLIKIRKYVKYN